MVTKINQFKTDLMYSERTITAQRIMDFVNGKSTSKAKLMAMKATIWVISIQVPTELPFWVLEEEVR